MKLVIEKTSVFQEKYLPADTTLAGLSALVNAFKIEAPVRSPACISKRRFKESIREIDNWKVFDNKYAIKPDISHHLTFAIRHENIDLLVLKKIFLALPEKEILTYIQSAPTGPISRKVWFLYEFLTEKKLKIPDCSKVTVVDLLDKKNYFVSEGIVSTRHKVRNNLLGTAQFCPIVRRTEILESFLSEQLSDKVKTILSKISPQLVARAASFLLLADSQASFAIEGESLPRNKEERWLRAIQQVGRHKLTIDELNRLHDILIEDHRFIKREFRNEGVFLGQRSYDGIPLPEFIGARPEDLKELVEALIETNALMHNSSIDAVIQAAAIAFGFVYIHPYQDGNGRLHRCLIHHVLAEKKFNAQGVIFPVSSVMLKQIDNYREVLQNHTAPLMPYINWAPTNKGNVEVLNDTSDLYRYFDCTQAAEFLYSCVKETIEKDVPNELDYLKRHDKAMKGITNAIEMPDRMVEDFIMFMRQNNWQLSKKRRENEFKKLTDKEVTELEEIVQNAFDGFAE